MRCEFMDTGNLARKLLAVIDESKLAKRYKNERMFEKDIHRVLKKYLKKRFKYNSQELKKRIVKHGENEKEREFWTDSKIDQDVIIAGSTNTADIFIRLSKNKKIVVQLKYTKTSIAPAIQTTVGQCIISHLKHPSSAVIGIVFAKCKKQNKDNKAKGGDRLKSLKKKLEKQNFFLLVKFI